LINAFAPWRPGVSPEIQTSSLQAPIVGGADSQAY
jgi:hypothetical protein